MKKILILIITLLFITAGSMYGQSKNYPDEIRLKDGSLVIGEIIEYKPDKGYWMLLPTRETKFYEIKDIESVRDRDNSKQAENPIIINNNNNNVNNNNVNNVITEKRIITERRVHVDTVVVKLKPIVDRKGYLALVIGAGSSVSPVKKDFAMSAFDFSYLVTPHIGAGLHIASTKQTPYVIGTFMAGPMLSYEIIKNIRVEGKTMIGIGNIHYMKTDSTTNEEPVVLEDFLKTGSKLSYSLNAQARLNLGRSWCLIFGYDLTGVGNFIKSEFFAGFGVRMF